MSRYVLFIICVVNVNNCKPAQLSLRLPRSAYNRGNSILQLISILWLWFVIAAPVSGVSSSDELASFTAPEITLPVSPFHFMSVVGCIMHSIYHQSSSSSFIWEHRQPCLLNF